MTYDNLIIGGGFFGCMIAEHLKGNNIVLEKENKILTRASVNNQARVHNGYHYPRHLLTAKSSHANYEKFISEFTPAVKRYGPMLYPIAYGGKTTAANFRSIYSSLGCPIRKATKSQCGLFNKDLIEDVFSVEEAVFDGDILRNILIDRANYEIEFNSDVLMIGDNGECLSVAYTSNDLFNLKPEVKIVRAKRVFLCAYDGTNEILRRSSMPEVNYIVEKTLMPLVKIPKKYRKLSITIMDGDFFSVMPFPMQSCHSIHHVKLTPERAGFDSFYQDLIKFIPGMEGTKHVGDVYENKVIFPTNKENDGRPILYHKDYNGIKGLDVVVGGKLDNIYDVFHYLDTEDKDGLNII